MQKTNTMAKPIAVSEHIAAVNNAVNSHETALNSETTDSVVQADTEVAGLTPAGASGNYYQGSAHALGLAALNATGAQQQNNITIQAATPVEITNLYSVNTAPDSSGNTGIFGEMPQHKTRRIGRVRLKRK